MLDQSIPTGPLKGDRMLFAGFDAPLTDEEFDQLADIARRCRGAVLTMTTLAASGHPGGSMSSMEMYTLLFHCARLRPAEPGWPERDRVLVSHGHTSPGVYTSLASAGFFPMNEAVAHFRQYGSIFEGHVERSVPGVEWSTGNLGQGLSVGVGMALGARLTGSPWQTFVAMSDGEQHKGQVAEARRLAAKEGLGDLTVVIDMNGIQISGRTADVMPVHVAQDYAADGWGVIEADGHDLRALHGAIAEAVSDAARPVAIVAHTTIGKGVSFMEDEAEYHGRGLTEEEYAKAMAELGLEPDLELARARRPEPVAVAAIAHETPPLRLDEGTPREYDLGTSTDNRSAWGTALKDIAETNPELPMAVLDCDLAVSVKTDAFAKVRPGGFIQCGVGEHNAATTGGALSASGVLTFFSDFGVFGCDEVYNQQRLNDINGAALKLAMTHCGLDVGEDGKTHQCLDYVGAFRNLFGWRVIVPADPNQTDRATRAAAGMAGNVALAMGRSKLPVIADAEGNPAFGGGYRFRYGRVDQLREGAHATVMVMGTPVAAAVLAADELRAEGIGVCVCSVPCPLHLDDADMELACSAPVLLTVEDHCVRTGLAASVTEWIALSGRSVRLVRLGVDGYRSSGPAGQLLSADRLDSPGIASAIRGVLGD